jgi:hypothetical protein
MCRALCIPQKKIVKAARGGAATASSVTAAISSVVDRFRRSPKMHAIARPISQGQASFNSDYPQTFQRWVQFSTWQFCAAGGYDICNSNRIDDRAPCDQRFCPSFTHCDRCAT